VLISVGGCFKMIPTAEGLAWMSGAWRCQIWGGIFEEVWSSPLGGMLAGAGKHVVNGELRFLEFLSVQPDGEGLTMTIRPSTPGKYEEPLNLPLVNFTALEAVFENASYEFPRTITYRRIGDALLATVEGIQKGQEVSYQFDYRNFS